MNGLYRFAVVTVEISTLGEETHALCAAYRAEGVADFSVETGLADIDAGEVRVALSAQYSLFPAQPITSAARG